MVFNIFCPLVLAKKTVVYKLAVLPQTCKIMKPSLFGLLDELTSVPRDRDYFHLRG
jgi:hypothetical protein